MAAFSYFASMFIRIKLLLISILLPLISFADADSVTAPQTSGLRISLLTCGPGTDQIYEVFGHTAIRVTDSNSNTDMVYNYGTFNGYTENFEMKFMRGKLLYYVSKYPYSVFLKEYTNYNRTVEEQVLLISDEDEIEIRDFLANNALEANKYYKYDFYFDNCATRIRGVFYNALGDGFKYGNTLPQGQKLTFRDITNEYFYREHWVRLGVNILLGTKTDKVMTNDEIMFLPDFLRDGMEGATLKGKPVATPAKVLYQGQKRTEAGINTPFLVTCAILMLTLLGLLVPSFSWLGKTMSFLVLFITGLLGIIMLIMWFGTDHQACQSNYNVLWALPTNLFFAFAVNKGKSRYASIAIVLLIVALILHLLQVQALPLFELTPLFLSLLAIYGSIIKKADKRS